MNVISAARRPHEDLAGVALPKERTQRMGGWRQALTNGGIPYDPDLEIFGTDGFEFGAAATDHLLNLPNPPTAIFSAQDLVAIGVLSRAKERGLRIPEELSVVGFDDTYANLWPSLPLTSVKLPLDSIGSLALTTAFGMSQGTEPVSRPFQLATSLVERGSTAPLPRQS